MQCPNCQSAVTPNDRFCGECGQTLIPASPPPSNAPPPELPRSPLAASEAKSPPRGMRIGLIALVASLVVGATGAITWVYRPREKSPPSPSSQAAKASEPPSRVAPLSEPLTELPAPPSTLQPSTEVADQPPSDRRDPTTMVITSGSMNETEVRELLQRVEASRDRGEGSIAATRSARIERILPDSDQPRPFPWYRTRSEATVLHDPQAGARVVVTLPEGMRVRVSGATGEYFEVRGVPGGLNGYVLKSRLEPESP